MDSEYLENYVSIHAHANDLEQKSGFFTCHVLVT